MTNLAADGLETSRSQTTGDGEKEIFENNT
jgi:hypothetical protein